MTEKLRFGMVGTGLIAGFIAKSIISSKGATLTAVSSRKQERAQAFVSDIEGAAAVEGIENLLAREDVDAVYVATPTSAKESIALAAIAAGKHVLVEKAFMDSGSVKRMAAAAASQNVLFLDATHFVHHPRTAAIRQEISNLIASPLSLHTTFCFPFSDRSSIRFDPTQEPAGVLGDMGWYPMRAVVEYLQPSGELTTVAAVAERDAETKSVIRLTGLLGFASGETSTFDIGYTAGAVVYDLSLLGTAGMIVMDDFVLDWNNSIFFQNPDIQCGYIHRKGIATRQDFTFIETPSEVPADVLMIERFTDLANSNDRTSQTLFTDASLQTQSYLDAIWEAIDQE